MGQNGLGISQDVSATLNTIDTPAVCAGFKFHQQWNDPYHPLCAGAHPPEICMASTQTHAEVDEDLAGALTARCYKDAPVVCMADDTQNAAVDVELSGSLKVVGATVYSDRVIGALCARDYKGVGSQYVNEGKLIVDGDE